MQTAAQADHRLHVGGGARVLVDIEHERLVDLHPIELDFPKMKERRIARPEIVERNGEPDVPQRLHHSARPFEIVDERTLSDLYPSDRPYVSAHGVKPGHDGGRASVFSALGIT